MGPQTQTGYARDFWSNPFDRRPSASRLGTLFDTTAPSTVQSRLGCLSKPWALGHGPESPESLVDPVGPHICARVDRDIRLTHRGLGHGPESPGTAGRLLGASDPSASRLRQLVNTEGLRTRAPVAWDSRSTPRAIGHQRERPGTAGPPRRPLELGQSHLGNLVDPRGLGHEPVSPLRPGRNHGPSETVPSVQMHRVNLAGPGTRARVTRYCWSNPQALGHKRVSPGRTGRLRVPSVEA